MMFHRARWSLLAFLVLPLGAESSAHEWHASNELILTHNDVSGPGRSTSNLTDGLNAFDLLSLYGNGRSAGGWAYNYALGLKATDDRALDVKTVSLVNADARVTNGVHTASLGDVFESFSQYALATALKGGSYRFARENSRWPEVTAVLGWAYPRWDSLWKDSAVRSIKRQGAGLRVKENLSTDFWVGASHVATKDTAPLAPTDPLYEGRNATFDFGYTLLPGLTLGGEYSRSRAEETTGRTLSHGSAARWEIVADADPSRVTLEYENVTPAFFSALGSATPDRRKAKGKWRYKASRRVTVNTGLLWFRDNLDGRAAGTQRHWRPEVGVSLKRPFAVRPRSAMDLTYRFDRRTGAGSSAADHYANGAYRDRFGPLDSDTNVGYTLYRTRTDVRDAAEVTANTALASRHAFRAVVLKPSARAGAWYAWDDLAHTTDRVQEYSFGVGVDAPSARVTTDLRVGRNALAKGAGDSSARAFASLFAAWRPARFPEATVTLRGARNDFRFTTDVRNFRETSVTLGLNTAF